jgi:transcriptional regulator with XRE-family HTH domain
MYPPGLRLRQSREKLKLTYREVEKASYELAAKRGRREFILHISRLADIENRNVIPSLHKLYSLAVIYHVDAMEIASWYEAPFLQRFQDESAFPSAVTHLSEVRPEIAAQGEENFARRETELLKQLPPALGSFPATVSADLSRCRYGYVGLADRRMAPILRPGSIVLVDTGTRNIEDRQWWNEYERPIYFVELKEGYRCGWFQKERSRLMMQPHVLSRCAPEVWHMPEEAEVVGKVVGLVMSLTEPFANHEEANGKGRGD